MSELRPDDPEALLAQSNWLRRLARGLVRDESAAEDLAQDTWVAALRAKPADLRAWMNVVARNFARRSKRDAGLRAAHEPRAAHEERIEGPDEIATRVELQRKLAEALLALEEPFRSALVLRYLDGLSTIQVAEKLGVSHDAARQRISRGLAKLRERLDREHHGGRAGWVSALVPFAHPPTASITGGLLVMSLTMKLALLGAAALLGVCLWIGTRSGGSLSPEKSATALAAQTSPIDPAQASNPLASTGTNGREALADPAAHSAAPPATEEPAITGEVRDATDKPVAGALVVASSLPGLQYNLLDALPASGARVEGRIESDGEGRFRLRVPARTPIQLEVDGGARGLAIAGERYSGEHVIVHLAAACSILGRVTRERDGAPVSDARVLLVSHSPDRGEDFVRLSLRRETRSDAGGYYRIEGLPQAAYDLRADVPGVGCTDSRQVEPKAGLPCESNFQVAEPCIVRGVVRDAMSGAPIENAEVGAGWRLLEPVRTDARGEYVLHGSPAWLSELSARAAGYGLKQLPYARISAVPAEGRLDFDLVPARRCKGLVLSRAGQPLEGVYVAACACEYTEVESLDWRSTQTRADGRFEIDELRGDLPHALFLRKEGYGTLVYEFPADEAQQTTVDLGETRMDPALILAGRVVDDADIALPGLQIGLFGANADRGRWNEARSEWLDGYVESREGRSDHEGRFAFGELAAGSYEVRARVQGHNDPVRATVVLEPGHPIGDVKLVVPRGLVIAGVVEDREHRGIPSTYVSIEPENEGGTDLDVPTDEQGHFRAESVRAGSYTLRIWPYANTREKPKERFLAPKVLRGVRAGSATLTITLEEGVWVRGQVLDAQGQPAPNVTLQALDAQEQSFAGSVSSEDGHFEFGVERDARFTLLARPPRPSTAYAVGWEPDPEDVRAARLSDVAGGGEELLIRLPLATK